MTSAKRPDRCDGILTGLAMSGFCVFLILASVLGERCVSTGPLMRECRASGGVVVRGAHGDWTCQRGDRDAVDLSKEEG